VRLSRHTYVLLVTADSGTAFPGLEAELTAAGASTVDWTADCAMLGFSGWERFSSGLITRKPESAGVDCSPPISCLQQHPLSGRLPSARFIVQRQQN